MSDHHVSPSSTPPADHAPATDPGRVPSDAAMAPMSKNDLADFHASLLISRLSALGTDKVSTDPYERIASAAAHVAFVIAGPSRATVGERDLGASCDPELFGFNFLHNARARCLSFARRHDDPVAAADAFHAFVFDGLRGRR